MIDTPRWLLASTLLAGAVLFGPQSALAQAAERSGKDVVEAVCAKCHAKGENGAPRIGDKKAWGKRASQGLTSLTEHALTGIRNMPAHGGSKGLSDYEIQRATVYLVNSSGGNWIEPRPPGASAVKRSGEQVVKEQCSQCHLNGYADAPRIGDHANWQYYLRLGMDAAVRKVVRGHGDMPPRGGEADLTDEEIRAATIVMARKPPRKPR